MSITAEAYDTYYQYSLPDEAALDRHWTGERYNDDLAALGVGNPAVTDLDVSMVRFPYMQPSRYFHRKNHPIEVGNVQPNEPLQEMLAGTLYEDPVRAAVVMRFAGDFHDIGYKNVDADPFGRNAWPPHLIKLIDGMADWQPRVIDDERHYETYLTDKGKNDELTRMVAYLFELPEDGVLSHKTGGSNELDSALAAVQFLKRHGIDNQEKPLEKVDLVAVAAIIAATIPFRQNARLDEHGNLIEGNMERLGRRVHTALLGIGYDSRVAYRTTNAIMAMGACVANRDASPFMRPDNMPAMANDARLLRAEDLVLDGRHVFREPVTTMSGLTRGARLMYSAPGLYQRIMLGEIPPEDVPTFMVPFDDEGQLRGLEYSYPPQEAHTQATGHVHENVEGTRDLFLIHEVGITAGRVLLRQTRELDSEVPGGVEADVWISTMQPTGEKFDQLQARGGMALKLYQELSRTAHYTGLDLVPDRHPLSMMVLGSAGLAGTLELSGIIQGHWEQIDTSLHESDPYFDTARAEEFRAALLEHVKSHNYNTMLDILMHAALFHYDKKRLRALERQKT